MILKLTKYVTTIFLSEKSMYYSRYIPIYSIQNTHIITLKKNE